MSKRLGRGTAGARVAARVTAMSDALLAAEETCFREIEYAFAVGHAIADPLLQKALKRSQGKIGPLLTDMKFQAGLTQAMTETIDATNADVAALTAQSVALSLESIEDELGWCEETLPARYKGTAVEGVTAVRDVSDDLVTEAMEQYRQATLLGVATFVRDATLQTRLALQRQETPEILVRRLFDASPAGLIGCSGRGVWWRPMSGLQAAARGVAIGLSNAVREGAMIGMNDASRRR